MGVGATLVATRISAAILWAIIYFVTGTSRPEWQELFVWAAAFTLIGTLDDVMQLVSQSSGFILLMKLTSAAIVAALLYVLLTMRLGIINVRHKVTIVSVFVGLKIVAILL